jgi:hypothetical protein
MLVWLCEIVSPARRGAESARAMEPRTEIIKGQKESSLGGRSSLRGPQVKQGRKRSRVRRFQLQRRCFCRKKNGPAKRSETTVEMML